MESVLESHAAADAHSIQWGMWNSTRNPGLDANAEVPGASYPASPEDEILPSIPSDPLPNPEPEQPSLGIPDPGIYEGTGGTASLGDDTAATGTR